MNYLAHAWLAGADESTLFGAVVADHIKGRLADDLPAPMRLGILQHRRLDRFVDDHPSTRHFLSNLSGNQRRYGGILLDMIYDHLLATQWLKYTAQPSAQAFADHIYQVIQRHRLLWPQRFHATGERMIRNNWLGRYAELEVMKIAVQRVGEKVRGGEALIELSVELEHHLSPAQIALDELWPELSVYAQSILENPPTDQNGAGH